MSLRAVHQVLATLGYGDAIGHEVLGIQRVLRAAGYDSEIFVETADTRLEDLTYDYRDLVDASHPDNLLIHHFSIGSRASRVAYALPDRMALVYHNITPPEYFVGVHKQLVELCWKGRRELKALRRPLRSRAGRLGVQPAGTGGARLPGHRRAAGRSGLLAPRRHPRLAHRRPVRRRVHEHPVCRPDDPEQADRERHPHLPRLSDALQPAVAPAAGGQPRRLREVPDDAAPAGGDAGHARRALQRARQQRGAGRVLRRRRPVPVRQRARGLLRAAGRSVPHAGARGGAGGHGRAGDARRRRRAVRGPRPVPCRGAGRRGAVGQAIADNVLAAQDAALGRLLGKDFGGTLLGFVDRIAATRRAGPRLTWRSTSGISCARTSGSKNCGCSGPAAFKGLPK